MKPFTKKPFFSAVIPTYERPDDLRICLNSLSKKIQHGSQSYEIIVTDDSKSDESRKIVEKEFPDVSWGKGKQNGPAGNRNAGVDRAKGEWIVFLDDDCIAQEGYLKAYANAIKANAGTLVFEGRIFANRPRNTWAEGCPENEHGGMLWTSNLCVSRKLFMEMGGLDERFQIAYEDVDFALRLKQKGIQSIFVSDAAVCHPWRTLKQEGNNWKKAGYQLQELMIFLEKHPDQYPLHSARVFFKHCIRGLVKEIPYGCLKFKGKGTLFKTLKSFQSFYCAVKVFCWNILRNFKFINGK
jgi:GT2 family glycosyltransferase